MSNNITENIWLIGAGYMAIEYAKVLDGQNRKYTAIGRGKESAQKFIDATGHDIFVGGIDEYIATTLSIPEYAIIAVNPEFLQNITIKMIELGVKKILVEKPAGLNTVEIEKICVSAKQHNVTVYVAYNRHFYASVIKAKQLIKNDGGVLSFNFEFTEWIHTVDTNKFSSKVLSTWFLSNSTHVVDLAFFLGGEPKEISCYVSGSIPWYSKASAFSGAGITENGALFSYKANWESAGRWALEVLTKEHKYIFAPLEKLQVQNRGSVKVDFVEIDDKLDIEYKPGLYLQVEAFLNNETLDLIDIEKHYCHSKIYEMMEKNSYACIDNN